MKTFALAGEDGWWPQLSPDGRYVAYGNVGVRVADLATGQQVAVFPEQRQPRWILPDTLSLTRVLHEGVALRAEAVAGPWLATPTREDGALVAGNDFDARDGHWASALSGVRLAYDNRVLEAGRIWGCTCDGDDLLAVAAEAGRLHLYRSGVLKANLIAQTPAHVSHLHRGHIAYGGYGPMRVVLPDGTDLDVTVSPDGVEGSPWLFTYRTGVWLATVAYVGRPLVLLRPADPRVAGGTVIALDVAATYVQVVTVGDEAIVATSGDRGQLVVQEISLTQPRTVLTPAVETQTAPRWAGYFYAFGQHGNHPDAPGNCTIVVDPAAVGVAATLLPVIISTPCIPFMVKNWDRVVAIYIGPEGTLADNNRAADAAVAAMQALHLPRRPVLAYFTAGQLAELPAPIPNIDWVGPQCYFDTPPSAWDVYRFWTDVLTRVPAGKVLSVIAQSYDRSRVDIWSERLLAELQPKLLGLAADSRVNGIFWFAYGRPGGALKYPRVKAWHGAYVSALPGTPPIQTIPSLPPAPRITITAPTFPLTVTASAVWTATAALEPGSGPVTSWAWLDRRVGQGWTTRSTTLQPTTSYTFTAPGLYEIAVRATGPGGTAMTGTSRLVTVTPAIPKVNPPMTTDRVTFRSSNGFYLCAEEEGKKRLVANRRTAGGWEGFDVNWTGRTTITLKAVNGKYVCAENGGDGALIANRDVAGPWETFTVEKYGEGIALRASNGKYVCAEGGGTETAGVVIANREKVGDWETWTPSVGFVQSTNQSAVAGRLRVEGRFLKNDAGIYRPVWTSGLAILSRPREQAYPFIDWVAATGYNGFRIFAGLLGWANQTPSMVYDRLPDVLHYARAKGLYVEVTALTDSGAMGGGYDTHVQRLGELCASFENTVIEIANEPWHPTQATQVRSAAYLRTLRNLVPTGIAVAYGAAQSDESDEMSGGNYVTAHLDRGRDKWNMVRRVRELEALSDKTHKFVLNNEPIKGGSQLNDPAVFFAMGVLNRVFEVGGVMHSDHGLQATLPDAGQQALDDAFVKGARLIQGNGAVAFKNAGWGDSPVDTAAFDKGVIRAYSAMGEQNVVVLVGLLGDPQMRMKNGWNLGETLAEMPGVKVVALTR